MRLTKDLIISSLHKTIDEFGKNELAFLALTTKIELPLRDRWGYVLYKNLADSNFSVSREWKRTDIAILENGNPKILIEIKTLYTFDAISSRGYYARAIDLLQEDENKALKLANVNTKIYTVLFVTHPLVSIPTGFENIVKYTPGINGALSKLGSADAVAGIAQYRIREKLRGKYIVSKGVLPGGNVFGVGVDVLYWIVCKK